MYKSNESLLNMSSGIEHWKYNPCEILEYAFAFILLFQVFHINLTAAPQYYVGFFLWGGQSTERNVNNLSNVLKPVTW